MGLHAKLDYWFLRMIGIKIDTVNIPPEVKKCVLLFAPHTSLSDFVVGHMALTAMGVKTKFVMKKEAFWFPLSVFLKAKGAVPVNRQHASKFPVFAANLIKDSDEMALLISPEGTRSLVKTWKKGFYFIAQLAEVPIALGYLDYKTRTGGIMGMYYPTGDYEHDLAEIQQRYVGMRGLHKGQFNLE